MNSPLPPHPKYTISRRYNRFRIIHWRQVAAHWEGDEVGEFSEFEMARQALYDLNGWTYKAEAKQEAEGGTELKTGLKTTNTNGTTHV